MSYLPLSQPEPENISGLDTGPAEGGGRAFEVGPGSKSGDSSAHYLVTLSTCILDNYGIFLLSYKLFNYFGEIRNTKCLSNKKKTDKRKGRGDKRMTYFSQFLLKINMLLFYLRYICICVCVRVYMCVCVYMSTSFSNDVSSLSFSVCVAECDCVFVLQRREERYRIFKVCNTIITPCFA